MFQEIAIILIGILTAGYILRKLYRLFFSSATDNSPCAGCGGRCQLSNTRNGTCPPEDKKKKDGTNEIPDFFSD